MNHLTMFLLVIIKDQWVGFFDLQVDCPLYHGTLVLLFIKFLYKILRISSFDPVFGWIEDGEMHNICILQQNNNRSKSMDHQNRWLLKF
jgi:hypothetical protein